MTEDWKQELEAVLKGNPEGVFEDGSFDLDVFVDPGSLHRYQSFSLWLDGDTRIEIPLAVNEENARSIQQEVRRQGREVIHTWGMQYRKDL